MRRGRRPSAGGLTTLAARLLLLALGLAALGLPLPTFTGLPAVLALLALPVPFLAAGWPDSGWVTGLLVVSLAEWVVTAMIAGAAPPALTIGYGCLLYLIHTVAAFVAALPVTRRVEPAVVTHRLLRLGGVLALSVPLMLLTLLAPDLAGSPLLGVAGILAALGIGVVLVVLLHRRQPG
jgi:hypothetical protein